MALARFRVFPAAILTAGLLAGAMPLAAKADTSWTALNGSWFDPSNWTDGVPNNTQSALIDNGGTSQITSPDAEAVDIVVGDLANGSLTIGDGGTLASHETRLGNKLGSAGRITVAGENATWTNSSYLFVGVKGSGELSITDGANVSSEAGAIGYNSSSNGAVSVSDANSVWSSNSVSVGGAGNGLLAISHEARVDVERDTFIGSSTGTGVIRFDGGTLSTTTLWTSPISLSGTGTVQTHGLISDIELVFDQSHGLQQQFMLASEPNQNVTIELVVDGIGSIGAGYKALGTLRIADGMVVESNDGHLGKLGNSDGRATVTGDGSHWITSLLEVGDFGIGRIIIENGAIVTSGRAVLGYNDSGNGTAVVSGAGSTWNDNDLINGIVVGRWGTGSLTIEDGGAVKSVAGLIGASPGSIGTATIRGADSSWSTTGTLTVGGQGTGKLVIEDGGSALNHSVIIGAPYSHMMDSPGMAVISGQNSAWSISSSLDVGYGGAGELTIRDGAEVTTTRAAIGSFINANGTVTIQGLGSVLASSSVVTVADSHGAEGTLNVLDGGKVSAEARLLVGQQGALRGNGTVIANVESSGTVHPGKSIGSLHIDGDYTQLEPGELLIELASVASYDSLAVTGSVTLDGSLDVALLEGFAPTAGQSFAIVTTGGVLFGTFDTIKLPALADELVWDVAYRPGTVALGIWSSGDFNRDGVVDAADYTVWRNGLGSEYTQEQYNTWKRNFGASTGYTASAMEVNGVPEPTSIALAMCNVIAVAMRRRKRTIDM